MIQKSNEYIFIMGVGLLLTPILVGIPIFIIGALLYACDTSNHL